MSKKTIIASFPIFFDMVMNIYDIEFGIEDYIVAGINDEKPRKYKLYTINKGIYFNYKGHRYYTHDFLRA